jgi:hypothetical protein
MIRRANSTRRSIQRSSFATSVKPPDRRDTPVPPQFVSSTAAGRLWGRAGRRGHARPSFGYRRSRKRGLIAQDWRARLPENGQGYTTTVVFIVPKGNPRGIHDWPDLVKGNVEVVTSDPKTSGNGKLTLLAAWGSVISRGGSEADAKDFVKALLDHAPFLVPAARAAGVAFSVEKRGDVQVAWENEALRDVAESKGRSRDRLSADQHSRRACSRVGGYERREAQQFGAF